MGRERILKTIKRNSIVWTVMGIVLLLLFLFVESAFILSGIASEDDVLGAVLFFALIGILGGFFLYFGIRGLMHPEKTQALKKNPDLLRLADELFSHIVYEDDFIILSDRIIANKKNITQMAFTDEVFLIYVYKQTTNFITTTKQLILRTARGQLEINIYGRKEATINQLAARIAQNCQYARLGYSDEGLAYVKQMRQLWEQDKAYKANL